MRSRLLSASPDEAAEFAADEAMHSATSARVGVSPVPMAQTGS